MIKYLLIFLLPLITFSQNDATSEDKKILEEKLNLDLKNKPITEVVTEIGKSFIGTNYTAHTLDKSDNESLVINLKEFDCTTFIENSLVLARCVKNGKTSFEDFKKELTKVRYRDGIINDYPSRLHYFSDWIYDNEKKGIVKNISKDLGGIIYPLKVSFMSKNRDLYAQIKTNDIFLGEIVKAEQEVNSREYYYIPKKDVSSIENKILSGSLIAITTSINGLDLSHLGIAVKVNNRVHLLHAPVPGEKVQISKKPLSEYLAGNNKQTGIMVIAPLEP